MYSTDHSKSPTLDKMLSAYHAPFRPDHLLGIRFQWPYAIGAALFAARNQSAIRQPITHRLGSITRAFGAATAREDRLRRRCG